MSFNRMFIANVRHTLVYLIKTIFKMFTNTLRFYFTASVNCAEVKYCDITLTHVVQLLSTTVLLSCTTVKIRRAVSPPGRSVRLSPEPDPESVRRNQEVFSSPSSTTTTTEQEQRCPLQSQVKKAVPLYMRVPCGAVGVCAGSEEQSCGASSDRQKAEPSLGTTRVIRVVYSDQVQHENNHLSSFYFLFLFPGFGLLPPAAQR